jgi:hypothetical protein
MAANLTDAIVPVDGPVEFMATGVGGLEIQEGSRAFRLLMPNGRAIGEMGTESAIREITGGRQAAQRLFSRLVGGGAERVPNSTYKGTLVRLSEGGTVGFRTEMTRSPGTIVTIDVNIKGIPIRKIKVNP